MKCLFLCLIVQKLILSRGLLVVVRAAFSSRLFRPLVSPLLCSDGGRMWVCWGGGKKKAIYFQEVVSSISKVLKDGSSLNLSSSFCLESGSLKCLFPPSLVREGILALKTLMLREYLAGIQTVSEGEAEIFPERLIRYWYRWEGGGYIFL